MSLLNNSPQSNQKLMVDRTPSSFGRTDSRQQRRRNEILAKSEEMLRRFAGRGSSGNPQWAEGMCPRSRRRSIIRAAVTNSRKAKGEAL